MKNSLKNWGIRLVGGGLGFMIPTFFNIFDVGSLKIYFAISFVLILAGWTMLGIDAVKND